MFISMGLCICISKISVLFDAIWHLANKHYLDLYNYIICMNLMYSAAIHCLHRYIYIVDVSACPAIADFVSDEDGCFVLIVF